MIIIAFLIIITLLMSAIFSASETAIFSIGKEELLSLKDGDTRDKKLLSLIERGEETLTLILLSNLFVNLTAISLVTKMVLIFTNSLFMVFITSTVILLVFGEIIPKNIALNNREFIGRLFSPILYYLLRVFRLVVNLFRGINRHLLRTNYRYLLNTPDPFITSKEHLDAIKTSASPKIAIFMEELYNFSEIPISKTAIHRSNIPIISNSHRDNDKQIAKFLNSVGVVLVYKNGSIKLVISKNQTIDREKPIWFPLSKTIGEAISVLRAEKVSSLLLLDEYGTFFGVTTIKTITEMLIDENHKGGAEITLSGSDHLDDYTAWFPDSMRNNILNFKTVNGILTDWLGRIPEVGYIFKEKSFIFTITKSEKNRITEVTIKRSR